MGGSVEISRSFHSHRSQVLLGYWPIQDCFKMLSPSVSSFLFVFDSCTVLCFYSNIMIISMAPLHTFGGFVQSSHVVDFCSFFGFGCKFLKLLSLVFPTASFDFFVFLSILSCKSLLQALRDCAQHSFLSFSSPRNFCPSCFANPLFSPFLLISQDLFAGLPQNTVKFIDCHLGFVVKCVESVCEFQCKLSFLYISSFLFPPHFLLNSTSSFPPHFLLLISSSSFLPQLLLLISSTFTPSHFLLISSSTPPPHFLPSSSSLFPPHFLLVISSSTPPPDFLYISA